MIERCLEGEQGGTSLDARRMSTSTSACFEFCGPTPRNSSRKAAPVISSAAPPSPAWSWAAAGRSTPMFSAASIYPLRRRRQLRCRRRRARPPAVAQSRSGRRQQRCVETAAGGCRARDGRAGSIAFVRRPLCRGRSARRGRAAARRIADRRRSPNLRKRRSRAPTRRSCRSSKARRPSPRPRRFRSPRSRRRRAPPSRSRRRAGRFDPRHGAARQGRGDVDRLGTDERRRSSRSCAATLAAASSSLLAYASADASAHRRSGRQPEHRAGGTRRATINRPPSTISPRTWFICPTAPSWKRIPVSAPGSTIRVPRASGCAA